MRRFFNWIVGLPIAVIVIAFAVANRQWVEVSFDPLSRVAPWASIPMPLWALLFFGIFIGVIAGWIGCWFAQGKWRKAAKDTRLELKHAQDEAQRLKRQPGLPAAPDLA